MQIYYTHHLKVKYWKIHQLKPPIVDFDLLLVGKVGVDWGSISEVNEKLQGDLELRECCELKEEFLSKLSPHSISKLDGI